MKYDEADYKAVSAEIGARTLFREKCIQGGD